MKYIRMMIGILLAGSLLAMTACHGGGDDPNGTEHTDTTAAAETRAPVSVEFDFERVSFEGDCHATEHLEEYLDTHLDDLLEDMKAHGITVDEYTEIRATPIHIINLMTGAVGLDAHFLPVYERGELVNAVSVNLREDQLAVSAAVSWQWMSQVSRVLKDNPQETYLLTNCLTGGWNYICLISSQNEVIYIVRPANGDDLPFESGEDYYSKLYDERLVISYDRLYGEG